MGYDVFAHKQTVFISKELLSASPFLSIPSRVPVYTVETMNFPKESVRAISNARL